MACYLFTWNPELWRWPDYDVFVEQTERGEPVSEPWSTGNTRRIQPGDRVFLLKQGREPRGIVGAGWTTSAVTRKLHWDAERAARGETVNSVEVTFERLTRETEPLPLAALTSGPVQDMNWRPAASGQTVPEDLVEALEGLWAGHIGAPSTTFAEAPTEAAVFVEGDVRAVVSNRYERNAAARKACLAAHGTRCCVCDISFGEVYGELGEGFIHVHHVDPIHRAGGQRSVDPAHDLRPVCPNCHAMLHRRSETLSVQELRALLRPAVPRPSR